MKLSFWIVIYFAWLGSQGYKICFNLHLSQNDKHAYVHFYSFSAALPQIGETCMKSLHTRHIFRQSNIPYTDYFLPLCLQCSSSAFEPWQDFFSSYIFVANLSLNTSKN